MGESYAVTRLYLDDAVQQIHQARLHRILEKEPWLPGEIYHLEVAGNRGIAGVIIHFERWDFQSEFLKKTSQLLG